MFSSPEVFVKEVVSRDKDCRRCADCPNVLIVVYVVTISNKPPPPPGASVENML